MTTRRSSLITLCLLSLATVSSMATAQDTTRSQTRDSIRMSDSLARRDAATRVSRRVTSDMRLRVQKDAGIVTSTSAGTLELRDARADSIASAESARRDAIELAARLERARIDSMLSDARMRLDSINAIATARRDSMARADSIVADEQMRQQQLRNRYRFKQSGLYIGVAGGTVLPSGDFETLGYKSGYDISVPIGWQSPSRMLGVRIDLGYSQFGGNSFIGSASGAPVTLSNDNPKVLSAAFNLTARLPVNASRSVALYGVGGAGLYHFRDFGNRSALGGALGNDVWQTNDPNPQRFRNKLGAQIGGGVDFGVGPASIFVESRFVNVFADRDNNTQFSNFFGSGRSNNIRWVPILIGVNLR